MRRRRFKMSGQTPRLLLAAVLIAVGLPAAVSSPAAADVMVTVVAGTGAVGYSGDGGPATAAAFSGLSAVTATVSGDVMVLDASNYALRRFAVGGKVATLAGGARDCVVVDPTIALNGFCNSNAGLASDPDGNVYVGEVSSIRRVDPAGGIYHYAGKYFGSGGYGDGGKFDARISPDDVHYNVVSGEIDFSEPTDLRKVTTDGNIVTFAGVYDNGSIACTQPIDGSSALGSCLGVAGFAVTPAGDIYLADNGYYTGGTRNAPAVWRLDSSGTLHLLAAGLPTLGQVAITPDGVVYVVASQQILKVAAGATTVYADLSSNLSSAPGAAISALAADSHGNLFAASSGTNQVYLIAAATPPPPPPAKLRIASLGDSVAAGEGTNYGWTYVLNKDKNNGKNGVWNGHWVIGNKNPTWLTDGLGSTNQWCHRSLNGYPNLVAAKLDADLRDTACSGAAAVNGALRHQFSYDSYKDVVPLPQLGSSTGDYDQPNPSYDAFAPDVVTITFGANDIDFATVVSRCYHSAESASFCDRDKGLNDIVTQALKYQKQSLELVISEVIHRGQLAGKTPKIFITTYYDPFPTPGVSCDDIKPKDFAGIRLGLSSGEVKWLKSKLVLLNQNIREVARKHREVAVVSLDDAFTGHQWCSETPWVYGPSIVTQPSYGANASPFHPTVTGQAVISNRVAAAIRKELKS